MNCAEVRETTLVADVGELTHPSGALAAHLETCAACRTRVAMILDHTGRLAVRTRTRRRRRSVFTMAAVPIAAAVVAAIALAFRRETVTPVSRTASLPVARRVSVTVARGQTATVLKTADPTVTVIWLTPGVGQ
jgi:anti-sigma factor RsiW